MRNSPFTTAMFLAWTLGSSFIISRSYAQVYKTLPKGVRMLAYRNVTTTPITAEYNQSQAETPLSFGFNATADVLSSASDSIKYFFDQLRATNPAAYNQFTYGEYKISGSAQLNVHGMGLGYGVTDRLTVYGILPYYTANVRVKYKQIRPSNTNEVSNTINQGGGSDGDGLMSSVVNALPAANASMLQSVVVNVFGYDEVGNWYGSGYGDMEVGATYLLIDKGIWGLSATSGVVAPTGRQDDPDLLQDIAFGDGQWDLFAEAAIGYSYSDHLRIGTTLRYTYQAPTEKTLRVPTNRDYTLSDQKGNFEVKFGDRIDNTWVTTWSFNDWVSVSPAYEVFYQMPSRYESTYGAANDYLGYNSDRMGHTGRITTSLSTIAPYLKKQFALPGQLNFIVQQTLAGQNVPKVGRFEVELRLLF